MPVFFVCAGLLGLLAAVLTANVGLMRGRKKIYLGDGGDKELETAIRARHPYELPEIVAVPVVLGLPGYLDWIAAETAADV